MQCNVGQTERIVRIVAGVLIIAAGFLLGSWWGVIGLIPLATGLIRWCPAWSMLGINTAKPS
ncbi:MAG: DUF2892 domain-containing protein [Gammaproteobacteria bacterium]|nr:DUF2892 domain-containing protein [Gammaproteobacteria bacterium]